MTSKIIPGKMLLVLMKDEGVLEKIKLLVPVHHDKTSRDKRTGRIAVKNYGIQDA